MSRNQKIDSQPASLQIPKALRYKAFVDLGEFLRNPINQVELTDWADRAHQHNNWFIPENVLTSLAALGSAMLEPHALKTWMDAYPEPAETLKIGVVMAGNIPAVGFHDAMCVLISGHRLLARLSSDDTVLMRMLLDKLSEFVPAFRENIAYVERINEADAYIATGSDNTARYFEYYFSKKPHIIRKNRTAVGVLTGTESSDALRGLAADIFRYYGLGCRNVSKVYVPAGYDFSELFREVESFRSYAAHHHKYFNNYEYNKSVLLINRVPHLDNSFLLIREEQELVSPLSVLFYEEYDSPEALNRLLSEQREKIQCVVGNPEVPGVSVPFGKSQSPGLTDYADGVDVMAFLSSLNR